MSIEEVRTELQGIQGKDFNPDTATTPTFAISVEGLEGTGKTHFGLMTCPLPIVHVNFGDRDATIFLYDMDKERREKVDFYSFHAKTEKGWTREEGKDSLENLAKLAKAYLEDGKMRGGTFIIDSGSSWWDVMQEVYVAPEEEKAITLAAAKGKDFRKSGGLIYGNANLIVSGVLNWIKNQGVYLIITHQKAQEWDKDGPIPGKYKSRINSKVPYIVEVRLNLTKLCAMCGGSECTNAKHMGRKHYGQVVKLGHKDTLFEGMTIENPTFEVIYKWYTGKDFPGGGEVKEEKVATI